MQRYEETTVPRSPERLASRSTQRAAAESLRYRPVSELVSRYQRSGDPALLETLLRRHAGFLQAFASRYCVPGGTSLEDLVQVAKLGFLAAVKRYDRGKGYTFLAFAHPTIEGTIKRYFRDQSWNTKAPRRLRELALRLHRIHSRLEQELGRSPAIAEMALFAGTTEELVLQAMELEHLARPISLDALRSLSETEDSASLLDCVGEVDPGYAVIVERDRLRAAIERLDTRMQAVVRLRFYADASQADVARNLGISQMHVSRLERQALRTLRRDLELDVTR